MHVIEFCINFLSHLCVVFETDTKRTLQTPATVTCLISNKIKRKQDKLHLQYFIAYSSHHCYKYWHNLILFVSANFVYCGSDKPLWHCTHAFTADVKCVYAICSSCKICIEETITTTSNKRRKRNDVSKCVITTDCEDPHSQNHKVCNLKMHCDDKHLTEANLSDNLRKGKNVPQKCSKCERIICNNKAC